MASFSYMQIGGYNSPGTTELLQVSNEHQHHHRWCCHHFHQHDNGFKCSRVFPLFFLQPITHPFWTFAQRKKSKPGRPDVPPHTQSGRTLLYPGENWVKSWLEHYICLIVYVGLLFGPKPLFKYYIFGRMLFWSEHVGCPESRWPQIHNFVL